MAGLDTLNITNSGLFNINKKIINSRVYSNSLIAAIGNPTILDGVASGFSSENYLFYSPLNLEEATALSINFQGNLTRSTKEQCVWELTNTSEASLRLIFENNKVTLMYNAERIFSFSNLTFSNEEDLKAYLTIETNHYTFTLNYGNKVLQKSGEFNFNIPLSTFTTIYIGNSSTNKEAYWEGDLNLKEFSTYKNGTFLYSPSEGTSWNFSNILISDGAFPLTDSTQTVAKHVYSYPIKEISRSSNTILLTCQIDENSYLTIKEIGLYINTPNGKVLFGSISNLNINKSKDLSYNLVFTVNTSISVVNAIGFPAENGIVVKDPEFVEFKDYTTTEQVNTYVFTNLERIIRMNAGAKGSYENSSIINNQAGIGHNRPQVMYRLQQELEKQEDCFNSVDTFAKLVNRFQKIIEEQVDYDALEIEGDLSVPTDGKVNGFTNTDYITSDTPFNATESWEVNTSFTTGDKTSGTIVSLSNDSSYVPMQMSILNGYCHLNINKTESINPATLNSFYFRDPLGDLESSYEFLTITKDNRVLSSTNGVTWTERASLVDLLDNNFDPQVAYGNNKFVAIDHLGNIVTSTDGSTWLKSYQQFLNPVNIYETSWIGIAYGNNKFVALGYDGYVTTSANGETWSSAVKPFESTTFPFTSITYGNEKFIAMDKKSMVFSSTDGVNWTPNPSIISTSYIWKGITFGQNNFVAISSEGYISTSATGMSWSTPQKVLPSSSGALSFNNGLFVTSSADNDYFYTSSDLVNWEAHINEQSSAWSSVVAVPQNELYAWQRPVDAEAQTGEGPYNFHCDLLPASSPVVQFPQEDNLLLEHLSMDSSSFTLSVRTLFSNIENTQYIIGGDITAPRSIKLFIENKKLYAYLYKGENQSLISDNLVSRYDLKPNRYYDITLTFNGEEYSLHYEMEPLEGEYKEEETVFIYSKNKISLNEVNTLSIGSNTEILKYHRNLLSHASAVAYGNNKFVALNFNGYVSTSTDEATWTTATQNANLGTNSWNALAYDGTKFVALGYYGHISTSTDGETWTPAVQDSNLGSNSDWRVLAYGNNKFVALNNDDYIDYISTSTDGVNWTPPVQNTNLSHRSWTALTYGGAKFVAIDYFGYISTSTDGETWTTAVQNTNLGSNQWKAIAYGGAKFVALSETGYISTSTDGETWTPAVQNTDLGNNYWDALAYDGTKFVALGYDCMSTSADGNTWVVYSDSTTTSKKPLITYGNGKFLVLYRDFNSSTVTLSPDGYSWSYQTTPTGINNLDPRGGCLFYDDSIHKFTTITYGGLEYTSTDGKSWEYTSEVAPFRYMRDTQVAYGNGIYVAISPQSGGISIKPSTWTTAAQNTNLGSYYWQAITYDGTKFIALSSGGYISTSTDGTTWTPAARNTNLGAYNWNALSYGDSKFVAISYYGHISTSIDGTTWTTAVQNTNLGSNDWSALVYDGTKFIALGEEGYISTSTDGTTWTPAIQDTNLGRNSWQDLAYDGTKLVSLDYRGYISTSTNGATWTPAVQNTNLGSNRWNALTYDGTKFVALGYNGYVSTSTDGETWTPAAQNTNLGSNRWIALTSDGIKLIALSEAGYISSQPVGWSEFDYSTTFYGRPIGAVYHNGKFIIIDSVGYRYTSTDGVNWSDPELIPSLYNPNYYSMWETMTYGNGKFFLIGSDNHVSTSTDGENWTIPAVDENAGSDAYYACGGEKLVGVNSTYDNYLYPSESKLHGSIDFSNFYLYGEGRGTWEGAIELNSICTKNDTPKDTDITYDRQSYLIKGTYANDYVGGTLISESLFPIEENTKYDVSISYSEDEETQEGEYAVSKMENNDEASKEIIFSKIVTTEENLSNRMSTPSTTMIGISPVKAKSIVSLSEIGYISTSTDGVNWTRAVENTDLGSYGWGALAYDGTKFVALSFRGYISTSTDGTTWTPAVENTDLGLNDWQAVAYGNNKFIALNDLGYISTSIDGVNWTRAVENTDLGDHYWLDLAYDGTKFVALSYKGGYISTSTDGETWTAAVQNTNLGNRYWRALAYDGTKFVALSETGYISTSTDGTTWTRAEYNDNLSNHDWVALTYDGTKFVALGFEGYTSTSTDGTTWTPAVRNNNLGGYFWRALSISPSKEELSNPYSSTINLLPWKVRSNSTTYSFSKEIETRGTELLQYYRIPDLNKNQYIVKDLCNLNRTIRFLNDKFEGNQDSINLLYPEGLTLCMKVDLKDTEPKSILYKSDLVHDVYCSLTFNNQTLSFTVMAPYGTQSISKRLELKDYASYIDAPALITIIVNPENQGYAYISMYKNNELAIEPTYIEINNTADPSTFVLSNYIEGDTEEGKYLSDLVVIKGIISQDDLNYINNLFDTNY